VNTLRHPASRALGSVLGLLLAVGIVPVALGAEGRPAGTNYSPRGSRGIQGVTVTPTASVTDLLQCLLGPNVTVVDGVLNAAPAAAGTFAGGLEVFGFDQGIALSSGHIGTLVGPNMYDNASTINNFVGDPDLDLLVPGHSTYDAASFTLRFTCQTASVISFQYVFGSEEYNESVNSAFNDVFGFFLNGVNIAVVPSGCSNPGLPVSINNVNCGSPYGATGSNCDCYRNNALPDGGGSIDTELDGLSQVFVATGVLQPGVNTIKLAIADVGDFVLDSDVMIRCQSFSCGTSLPTGACCLSAGTCVTLTDPDCRAQAGSYHGDSIPCVPNPCRPVPADLRSWGHLKSRYR
jgi:hypothetical protein